MRRTSARVLTTIAAIIAVLATTLGPASAAPPTRVDFTISESLAVTTGTLTAGSLPGCSGAVTVTTSPVTVSTSGPFTEFAGTKTITCTEAGGVSGTMTIEFDAKVRLEPFCDGANKGSWSVLGGTGVYASATGGGKLNGTYPGGDSCLAGAVDDRYTGRIRI